MNLGPSASSTLDIPLPGDTSSMGARELACHVLRIAYMFGLSEERSAKRLRTALARHSRAESQMAYAEMGAALDQLADPVFLAIDDWEPDAATHVIEIYDAAEAAVADACRRWSASGDR